MKKTNFILWAFIVFLIPSINAWEYKILSYGNATPTTTTENIRLKSDGTPCFLMTEGDNLIWACYANNTLYLKNVFEGWKDIGYQTYNWVFDTQENPHICFYNGSYPTLYYAYLQDDIFNVEKVDDVPNIAGPPYCDIAYNPFVNKVHIVTRKYASGDYYGPYIREYFKTSSWGYTQVCDRGYKPKIEITNDNYKYISLYNTEHFKTRIFNVTPANSFTYSSFNAYDLDVSGGDMEYYNGTIYLSNIPYPRVIKQRAKHSPIFDLIYIGEPVTAPMSIAPFYNVVYMVYRNSEGHLYLYDYNGSNTHELISTNLANYYPSIAVNDKNKYILYTKVINNTNVIMLAYEQSYTVSISGKVYDASTLEPIENAYVSVETYGTYTNETGHYELSDLEKDIEYNFSVTKYGYTPFNTKIYLSQDIRNFDIALQKESYFKYANATTVKLEFKWESNYSPVVDMPILLKLKTLCPGCAQNYYFTTSDSGLVNAVVPQGEYELYLPPNYFIARISRYENPIYLDLRIQTNYIYSFLVTKTETFNYTLNIKTFSQNTNKPLDNVYVTLKNTRSGEEYHIYTNASGEAIVGFSQCEADIEYIAQKENYSTETGTFNLFCVYKKDLVIYLTEKKYKIELTIYDYDTLTPVSNYSVFIYCPFSLNCFFNNFKIVATTNAQGKLSVYPSLEGKYIVHVLPELKNYTFYDPATKTFDYDFSVLISSTEKEISKTIYVKKALEYRDVYGVVRANSFKGEPIPDVNILFVSEDGKNSYTALSNETGGYFIEGVVVNKYYQIYARKTGYRMPSILTDKVFIGEDDIPYRYDLVLIPTNVSAKYFYIVNGSVVDFNLNEIAVEITLDCDEYHDFQMIEGYFEFNVSANTKTTFCVITISPTTKNIETFRKVFSIQGDYDFGTIILNKTTKVSGLSLCFENANRGRDIYEIGTIPNVNVTLYITTLTNDVITREGLTDINGRIIFDNAIYGSYRVVYTHDDFIGGEDRFTINEDTIIPEQGCYKTYKLYPRYQLYALRVILNRVEYLGDSNYTTKYPLSGAEVTLINLDRNQVIDKRIGQYQDVTGIVTFLGLPDGWYKITVSHPNYETQSKEFKLSSLEGEGTVKELTFDFIHEKQVVIPPEKKLEIAQADILGFLSENALSLLVLFIMLFIMSAMLKAVETQKWR